MKWVATICTLACVLTAAGDWPNPLGPAYTGVQKGSGFPVYWSRRDGVAWQVNIPRGAASSMPITVGTQILLTTSVASDDETNLISFDGKSGRVQWSKSWRGQAQVFLAADQERVVVAEESGVIRCFGLEGELLWEKKQPSQMNQLFVNDGYVFLLAKQGSVVKLSTLNGKQGKEVWSREFEMQGREGFGQMLPVLTLGQILVASANDLLALDPKKGKDIWRVSYEQLSGNVGQIALSGDGNILIRSAQSNLVAMYAVTPSGLQLTWKAQTVTEIKPPHFLSHPAGVVLLNAQGNELELLDRKTGSKRHLLHLPDGKYSNLVATTDIAYAYSEDREVVAIDLVAGKVLSRTLMTDARERAGVQGLAFLHDRLVVSDGLKLYCVTGTKVGSRAEEGSPSGGSPVERVGSPVAPGRRLPL